MTAVEATKVSKGFINLLSFNSCRKVNKNITFSWVALLLQEVIPVGKLNQAYFCKTALFSK